MNVRATSVKMEEHAGDLLRTMYACVHSTTLALPVQNVRMVVALHPGSLPTKSLGTRLE